MMRMFVDEEGKRWRVWHVVPQSDVLRASSPELSRGWLCFENDGEKRRLVDPPDAWHTADDDGLRLLLRGATPVKQMSTS